MKIQGIYARHLKRGIDFVLSLAALIVLLPLLVALTIVGFFAMGGNPFLGKRDLVKMKNF